MREKYSAAPNLSATAVRGGAKIATLMARFRYMVYPLALILVVIGGEVLLANAIGKIPPVWSLSMTLALLAGGMLFSLWRTAKERGAARLTNR